jgi:hypothetical protein
MPEPDVFHSYALAPDLRLVCTTLPLVDALSWMQDIPRGPWHLAPDPWRLRAPNPCPCPHRAGHRHYLFAC